MFEKILTGSRRYWAWVVLLLAVSLVGFISYLHQLSYGLGITGMGRDVSWGLYIANFTFFVGIAASAVVVVLPYYLHNYQEFRHITILGEFLAVAAVIVSLLFILVDLGQPQRVFNILLYPSPGSVLFWDMVVLTVYLLLNLIIGWSTLDAERKQEPPLGWIRPLIILSIPWAVSIHTVTAFIFSGLGARPFWLTAIIAPRFLASAFASGPALLIVFSLVIRRLGHFDPGKEALRKLAVIVTYALIANIFFLLAESFTVFYSGLSEPINHFTYLFSGLEDKTGLVPWIWTSLVLTFLSLVLLLNPSTRRRPATLAMASVAAFFGIWMEKGLGLLVPGFVPSPTGKIVEYWPTLPETLITVGVWALGLLFVTFLYKIAIAVKEQTMA